MLSHSVMEDSHAVEDASFLVFIAKYDSIGWLDYIPLSKLKLMGSEFLSAMSNTPVTLCAGFHVGVYFGLICVYAERGNSRSVRYL